MGFLYTPDLSKAPVTPDLKTSQLFSDFGWATMRTSWEKDATMLAVKSGHTWNHSHADANSFIVFIKALILSRMEETAGIPILPIATIFSKPGT